MGALQRPKEFLSDFNCPKYAENGVKNDVNLG